MKLYERFGDKGFHTSFATTFGVDFGVYEGVALSRLRGSGCHNNLLLADAGMLTYALDGASTLPKQAGSHYSLTGARATGVFHPKLVLQVGREAGRLIVASSNMTGAGLAGNLELAGQIQCTRNATGEQRIIAAAWTYIVRSLDTRTRSIAHQLTWCRARARWLEQAQPSTGPEVLVDGTAGAFLASGEPTGIGERYMQLVGNEEVNRLLVVSPYWDDDLGALEDLRARLRPREVTLLIDANAKLFPSERLASMPEVTVFDIGKFAQDRFVHAKLIVAQTLSADHVLFGSANCTVAALGGPGFGGTNAEACLYRRLPPGSLIGTLGLEELLTTSQPMPKDGIPPRTPETSIPLDEMSMRYPGQFESVFDTLYWQPPTGLDRESASLQLFALNESLLLDLPISGGTIDGPTMRFHLPADVGRPAYARVRHKDGTTTALAVVASLENLRAAAREARTKRALDIDAQLADETEEGLWLLEALDSLESAEDASDQHEQGVKRTRHTPVEAHKESYAVLPYDQFIAGRGHLAQGRRTARSSFAGTELSLIRRFLNRVLALHERELEIAEPPKEPNLNQLLNMGDNNSNGNNDGDDGSGFARMTRPLSEQEKARKKRIAKAERESATRAQLAKAVDAFEVRITQRVAKDQLAASDMLRLRSLITIIAAAGFRSAGTASRGPQQADRTTSLQVLPADDSADSWFHLMGRLLYAIFGGKAPAVRHLRIDNLHDQIPDDVIECWAACYWAIQACASNANSTNLLRASVPHVIALSEKIYRLTGLRLPELKSEDITAVFDSMSKRFAMRLGLSEQQLSNAHLHTSEHVSSFSSQGS